MEFKPRSRAPVLLLALIAVQCFCAAFFVSDALADLGETTLLGSSTSHLVIETVAAASLVAAVAVEVNILVGMLRRQARLERTLKVAQAAVHDVIEAHFDGWALSPSERDVATFLVKGLSITEIAEVRGSAEGTVKAHLNAIYRKSGTRNRGELLSLVIDGLMAETS